MRAWLAASAGDGSPAPVMRRARRAWAARRPARSGSRSAPGSSSPAQHGGAQPLVLRVVGDPDLQHRAVEIGPGHRVAQRLAVDADVEAGLGNEIEVDDVAL